MKLYADTHIPKQVAIQLRENGIDIVRCEEVGLAEATDIEHWKYAQRDERVVLTHDDDFLTLAAEAWSNSEEFIGVIYGAPHFQGKIGIIVKNCLAYRDSNLANLVMYMQSNLD